MAVGPRHGAGRVQTRRWQLGELSAWVEREALVVGDLADPLVRERFAAAQRAAGRRSFVSRLSLRVPVAYLREIGLVSETEPAATGPVEELLSSFRGYLASERGLTTGTIEGYERGARVFLEDRVARAGALELERLVAADVSGFLARECPRRSVFRCERSRGPAAPAASVSACRRTDRHAAGVGGPAGGGSPRPVASEGGRAGGDHRDVGVVRPGVCDRAA